MSKPRNGHQSAHGQAEKSMRKGEMTKQAILDEAVRTARFTGFDGLTLGILAAKTGMSKSGLYAHFQSKESLQLATMAHNRDLFITEAIRPALAQPRGEKRLRALISGWIDWYRKPGNCLFLTAISEFADLEGPIHDQLVSDERDLRDTISQITGTLITAGELDPDTDTSQVAQEVTGMLMGFNLTHRILTDPQAEKRLWVTFDHMLETYGKPRPGRLNPSPLPRSTLKEY